MYGWFRYGGTYSTPGWAPGEASWLQIVLAFLGASMLGVLILMTDRYEMPPEGVPFLAVIVVFFFLACVADAHPVVGGILLVVASSITTLFALPVTVLLWLDWRYPEPVVVAASFLLIYSLTALVPSLFELKKALLTRTKKMPG